VYDDHKVADMGGEDGSTSLMYIDRHLVHEVGNNTSKLID
jgi:homoaconitase/3-isopropylmalate dehydratase large subunit